MAQTCDACGRARNVHDTMECIICGRIVCATPSKTCGGCDYGYLDAN